MTSHVPDDPRIRCPECGARQLPGATCRECFDALLAFENERPTVFATVHHLTVATYFLQHPTGYRHDILAAWRKLIDDALTGRATTNELRRRIGREFAGNRRVKSSDARIPEDWPREWIITVSDVLSPTSELPSPDDYIASARRWATATRDALERGKTVER